MPSWCCPYPPNYPYRGGLSMGKSCKVVVCGQASVGKTSILEQLLYGNHVVGSEMIETQEDIYVGSIETDRGVREQMAMSSSIALTAESPSRELNCSRRRLTNQKIRRRSPSWSLATNVTFRSSAEWTLMWPSTGPRWKRECV
ncbi:NF-kappa-B inhibitor-interacting Ras-like protein 2 isoform X4 [Macrotis lagotis]|uniref:NF-kappa-B inhibitor-interacting Ras-like protein 2 isoform X4 n=1 Tax=Macrotis lagotis TaxID=92651 RepID=UPI003D68EFCA